MQNVFVYFHRNAVTDEVFYVGMGVKLRPYRTSGRGVLWNRVVAKYGFKVDIVDTFSNWDDAKAKEIEYIKAFGRIDNKTGQLVNHTDGGDGALGGVFNIGLKRSEETKKKMSDLLKGKPLHPNTIAARKLVSLKGTKKKNPFSAETLEKMAESARGKKVTDETKRKISSKLKGRVFSEETRKKNSEGRKRYWALKKAGLWLP